MGEKTRGMENYVRVGRDTRGAKGDGGELREEAREKAPALQIYNIGDSLWMKKWQKRNEMIDICDDRN